jgi:hypothetical protein
MNFADLLQSESMERILKFLLSVEGEQWSVEHGGAGGWADESRGD